MSDATTVYAPNNYGYAWKHFSTHTTVTGGETSLATCYGLVRFPETNVTGEINSNYVMEIVWPSHGMVLTNFVKVNMVNSSANVVDGTYPVVMIPDADHFVISFPGWMYNGNYTGTAQLQQPLPGVPTISVGATDVLNYQSYTWYYDDSSLGLGPVHRTWDPCDVCVSQLPQHSRLNILHTEMPVEFTVPLDGVMRFWSSTAFFFRVSINGYVWYTPTNPAFYYAYPLRVKAGDVIKMELGSGSGDFSYVFLPYEWPPTTP
jgi:hypothetical protein